MVAKAVLLGLLLPLVFADTEFQLPFVRVQIVCQHDIRSTFNTTAVFDRLFRYYVPILRATKLQSVTNMSGMEDITPNLWYYNQCDNSTDKALLTMAVNGTAMMDDHFNPGLSKKEFLSDVLALATPINIEGYFDRNVCNEMSHFKAVVDDPYNPQKKEIRMKHRLEKLCISSSGVDYVYDDEGPSGAFVLFGIIVGTAMFRKIFGELQAWESRTGRTRPGYRLAPNEIELV